VQRHRNSQWDAVWRRFNNSFDDDEKDFVAELVAAFEKHCKFISLLDLDHSVKLLKRLGHTPEAARLVKYFMDQKAADPVFFCLRPNVRGFPIEDPDVRDACAKKIAAATNKHPAHEILLKMYRERSWSQEDMATIVSTTVDDYYAMFKMALGDDHPRLVASALQFREIVNPESDYLTVIARAEEALRRIEQESTLNAERVSGLGIRPAPHLANPADDEQD
jgi:hypothetical protein